jgi:gliding motility-associated-like protein
MKLFLSVIVIIISFFAHGQVVNSQASTAPPSSHLPVSFDSKMSRGVNEICNNNMDDDGDGLIDMSDYYCYFNNTDPSQCIPSKMLWGISNEGLFWMNMLDNSKRIIGAPPTEFWGDITWAPNGKLYISEMQRGELWEMNPVDASVSFIAAFPGYRGLNGMTSDGQSNLYIMAKANTNYEVTTLLKYNTTTGQITVVMEIGQYGLVSGGDLVFMDNFLYVACTQSRIAKINLTTGTLQVITYTGDGTTQSFGLTSFGDGYLYMCLWNKLYQVDINTGISVFYRELSTNPFFTLGGTSSYSDPCNSPTCRPSVNIQLNASPPFCSNTGVQLKATGAGLLGTGYYSWLLPDNTDASGDTLRAFISGRYIVRYHSMPDTCAASDTIIVNLTDPPRIQLPGDTVLCGNNNISISPTVLTGASTYSWQDGSTGNTLLVQQPGIYWVQTSNVCGVARDSIQVIEGSIPSVYIGADTLLCPLNTMVLQNHIPPQLNDRYLWSTGQQTNTITIQQPGWYWLRSSNSCGTTVDSMLVVAKDSCVCNPVYAVADLGPDTQLCAGSSTSLVSNIALPQYRYLWQNGSTTPQITVNAPGLYWVQVSTWCNTVMDTIRITPKEDCSCNVYLPSAFTPNNDAYNDIFRPLCNCDITGTLSVFNRYGQMIFHTNNLRSGWDGTHKNLPQPSGSYVYHLNYKVSGREGETQKKGTIILIR